MSAYSYAVSVYPEMYGITKPAPSLSKAKIHFAEFVRPDSYWPQPYSIEQAFQTYRWMIKTGKRHSHAYEYGVYDMLIGGGVRGSADMYYNPVDSLDTLRKYFHRAVLARPNCKDSDIWRKKERIGFGEHRILHFPHYAPFVGSPLLGRVVSEAQIKRLLDAYFYLSGNLCVQLNSCHAGAIEIIGAVIRVSTYDFTFEFDLAYGYEGSRWWHHLAAGEQFLDTFGAALAELERVSGRSLVGELKR